MQITITGRQAEILTNICIARRDAFMTAANALADRVHPTTGAHDLSDNERLTLDALHAAAVCARIAIDELNAPEGGTINLSVARAAAAWVLAYEPERAALKAELAGIARQMGA